MANSRLKHRMVISFSSRQLRPAAWKTPSAIERVRKRPAEQAARDKALSVIERLEFAARVRLRARYVGNNPHGDYRRYAMARRVLPWLPNEEYPRVAPPFARHRILEEKHRDRPHAKPTVVAAYFAAGGKACNHSGTDLGPRPRELA
jgi:hypothetical protein